MRSSRLLIALSFVAAMVVVGVAVQENPDHQPGLDRSGGAPARPEAPPSIRSAHHQEGGPDARRAFELQRTVDPATGQLPENIFLREQRFAESLPVRDNPVSMDHAKAGNLSGWLYRGPYNLGGRTRAFALDLSDGTYQTFLAGGVSGGMWRTVNEGASWAMVTGSSQLHSVSTVAQDTRPGSRNVWYYGTGEISGNSAWGGGNSSYRGDGVFKSTDSGATWSLLPATSGANPEAFSDPWQYVNRVAVDASNPVEDEVYAATYGLIQRSTDGGATWNIVLGSFSPWSTYTDVVVSPSGVVYASLSTGGTDAGVFRSTDGVVWTNITPPGMTNHRRVILAMAPSDEDIVYAYVANNNGTANAGFFRYDYLSGDGSGAGGVWQDRSAAMNTSLPGGYYGSYVVNTQGSYCMSLAVKPDDPNTVFLGGVELTRSTDGFATALNTTWMGGWTYNNHHADQHEMFFLPGSSNIAYTGSDGGVHKTLDTGAGSVSWISLNNGYNTSQFYTVQLDEFTPGNDVVMGGTQDNGTQWTNAVNPTGNWIEQWGGDGSFGAVVNTSWAVAEYYFSSQNGRVYYEGLDAAGNWYDWTRIDPTGAADYLFINPFILDPNDDNMMYVATSNGVWRNSDLRDLRATNLYSNATQTLHWTQLTTTPALDPITALAVTRAGARTLYYGTESGGLYRVDNSHTAPGGTVPVGLTSPSTGYVSSIAIDPWNDLNILVSFSNYNVQSIWHSTNGGATWTDVEANLAGTDGPSVRSVRIVQRAGYEIWFCGTSVGLYSRLPSDPEWAREADDMIGTVVVDDIVSRDADGIVAVGTHGHGIYSIQIPEGVVANEVVRLGGAQRSDQGVTITWETSSALRDHLAYVYREERGHVREPVNVTPLPGDRDRVIDRNPPAGETDYHLKMVSPGGDETWYGPVTVSGAGAGTVFSMSAPAPNPFRGESSLAFNLPRGGKVNVGIYNVRGRLVRTLANDVLTEGPNVAIWDGRTDTGNRAASGIYYAKIQYGTEVRSQKLVLMK
ncbi:MAG: T9SS type A sorting domain-containing protein [bacterium]|nr:T9SS type A sorting domain-containing protein [bacterium]